MPVGLPLGGSFAEANRGSFLWRGKISVEVRKNGGLIDGMNVTLLHQNFDYCSKIKADDDLTPSLLGEMAVTRMTSVSR